PTRPTPPTPLPLHDALPISPNGRYAALASKYRDELADADVARLQIIDLDNNKTVQHTVGQAAASLAWSPDGKMLAVGSTSSLWLDRKSTRLNSSHVSISYAV